MPGLETVAFHSGYGTPIWMLTCSGRTPLVNLIPEAIGRLDDICGSSSVGRIMVIDAEGFAISFLKGLEQGDPLSRISTSTGGRTRKPISGR